MKVTDLGLGGVLLIEPVRHGDPRGVFSEIFRTDALADAGFGRSFIQENCARSGPKGVVRGMHMQRAPFAQDKLIRCSRGSIYDAAVDVRADSPTFGRSVGVELSAGNWLQLLVPAGFAHGYCTLEEDCEVLYKVTAPYAPTEEEGIVWSDPALGLDWPVKREAAVVNARDAAWPTFSAWAASKGVALPQSS